MNKTAIKNFAVAARVMLIDAVKLRAYTYEVTENGANDPDQASAGGRVLSPAEREQRSQLIQQIRQNGFAQTMEDAAYTWFNRFIALRFMEVNGYLPTRIRVFTDQTNAFKPEILAKASRIELDDADHNYIMELLDTHQNDMLYQYLLIAQCNALNRSLPEIFEKIDGWTELLFPSDLLRNDSVIAHLVKDIPEEEWRGHVQIIGWLYQYYNTELKDKVFTDLKKNIKISAEAIPAATQLFTPDWITQYMVENSLGRLWTEGHGKPENANWKYYLEEPVQEESVRAELEKLRAACKRMQPEQIKVIDPCMGSGHILVYAFDVLMDIYTSCGWSERDAALSILQNNLYGLDIDRRAYQLAYFAVIMKARQYHRSILKSGEIHPQLANFSDVTGVDTSLIPENLLAFAKQFADADTCGSLLEVTAPEGLDKAVSEFDASPGISRRQLDMMLKIERILSQKYDVVVTNPPYMGGSGMNKTLSDFVKQKFPDSKSDLFACFMEKGIELVKAGGYNCMVTMQSWMFLSSYEGMRKKLMLHNTMTHLMHMENMVMGIAFGTAVSCFRKGYIQGYRGIYHQIKLVDIQNGSPNHFPVYENRYAQISAERFSKIPGMPVAYWVSEAFIQAYERGKLLGDIADAKQGVATADNQRFLRKWYEVAFANIKLDAASHEDSARASEKWYPYNKGGDYRKWYGNQDFIINWQYDGAELKDFKKSVIRNSRYFFRECFSWSLISSGAAAFRYKPSGQIFDVAGMSCFSEEYLLLLLALCNSNVAMKILEVAAPTINYQCGDIANIPVILPETQNEQNLIEKASKENIALCRKDWDSYETSWDFERHPLI